MRPCLIRFFSGSRRPLPGEAVGSELPPTLRLHQRKLCAGRSWISVSHVPCASAEAVTLVFRAVDQRETSSAPRGLCRTPWQTSGGWCGSKTSGWSSWWRLWGTKTRWGRRSRSVSELTTDTRTHSDPKQKKMAVNRNLMNWWSNICMCLHAGAVWKILAPRRRHGLLWTGPSDHGDLSTRSWLFCHQHQPQTGEMMADRYL